MSTILRNARSRRKTTTTLILPLRQSFVSACQAGYRIEAAWTGYDYAGVLINRARASKGSLTPQAIQKIELQLDNALNVAKEVGSRPLEQRVISLSEKAAELIAPPDQNISDLTSREIEVLKLLGAGNTNKQIADELVIALNTAITHVGNILSKTGSANRVEAALYAAKHDLM
jgi:DNA-binding NarL/FixJ family response regulator